MHKLQGKIGLVAFAMLLYCTLYAGNNDAQLIQEAQKLAQELSIGLEQKKINLVITCTVDCADAEREVRHRVTNFLSPYTHSLKIESTENTKEAVTAMQKNFDMVLEQKQNAVSFATKLTWASIGAGICAAACSIILFYRNGALP